MRRPCLLFICAHSSMSHAHAHAHAHAHVHAHVVMCMCMHMLHAHAHVTCTCACTCVAYYSVQSMDHSNHTNCHSSLECKPPMLHPINNAAGTTATPSRGTRLGSGQALLGMLARAEFHVCTRFLTRDLDLRSLTWILGRVFAGILTASCGWI